MASIKSFDLDAAALLAQTNAAYAALRANRIACQALEEERRAWDATLSDGLDEYELEERME